MYNIYVKVFCNICIYTLDLLESLDLYDYIYSQI